MFPGEGNGITQHLADPRYAVKCFVESLVHFKSLSA